MAIKKALWKSLLHFKVPHMQFQMNRNCIRGPECSLAGTLLEVCHIPVCYLLRVHVIPEIFKGVIFERFSLFDSVKANTSLE